MIRDHEEVERSDQADALAAGCDDLFAPRKTVGRVRTERVAEHAGVGRVGRVQVRIAPVDTLSEARVCRGAFDVG